ncbi:MAG: 5,6-dimethylbenzimidazole synthase [Desulfuromonadales bacterium]|nr:5,6-dimethylbenzimidazole synthase [Desulfuromonadales bacterium]
MDKIKSHLQAEDVFSAKEKKGLFKAIFSRRDVRGQFKPDDVPDEVLGRILNAAHHAPSVGFMQPWNFVVIKDPDIKQSVYNDFAQANREAAEMFDPLRRSAYQGFKLEGIREAPINICVTCDRERTGPVVIGRTHVETMDLYSCVCAVQNLWLAARAENIGVGWVSILHEQRLKEILDIPARIVPVAYLCLGYTDFFFNKPELETAGWQPRLPLEELVFTDRWGQSIDPAGGGFA